MQLQSIALPLSYRFVRIVAKFGSKVSTICLCSSPWKAVQSRANGRASASEPQLAYEALERSVLSAHYFSVDVSLQMLCTKRSTAVEHDKLQLKEACGMMPSLFQEPQSVSKKGGCLTSSES